MFRECPVATRRFSPETVPAAILKDTQNVETPMSTDSPRLLYEHRMATRTEAYRATFVLLLVSAMLGAFVWFAAPRMWADDAGAAVAFIVLVLLGLMAGVAVYLVGHWQTDGEFVLRVDEQAISWSVPVRLGGRSARIPLADVIEIVWDEGEVYFLKDVHGKRHDVPLNYGVNPRLVVQALRQARPDVPVQWWH
jgi:hypothetical protein